MHGQRDVTLFEIIFSHTLDLFEDVSNLKVCGGLRECSLTNVIDLFKVKDSVEDALGLIESLLGDALALSIEVAIKLLQVDERDFRRLLDLAHNFLSEIVEVFFGIHELLEINHGVEVTDDEELVLAAGHVHIDLVHRDVLRISSISVPLHLWVVVLHSLSTNIE